MGTAPIGTSRPLPHVDFSIDSDPAGDCSIMHHGPLHPDDVDVDASWMRAALDQARGALDHDDVPVGAVVVRDGRLIAARHNERELTGDPTAHAEVLALRDAARHLGHWRLNECCLVVTLEPCAMCAGAIVNARVGRLVYGASDPKAGAAGSCLQVVDSPLLNHRIIPTTGVLADESAELLRRFFRARRNTPRSPI